MSISPSVVKALFKLDGNIYEFTHDDYAKKQFDSDYSLVEYDNSPVNYGLSVKDLNFAKAKLKKQSDFLANNFYENPNGDLKSFLELSYSANLSKRYYPRILNKVDTFVSFCTTQNLVPVFMTVTLDGFFRDLLKGDYTRYYKVKEDYKKHIPNNSRNGYYRDFMVNEPVLTPKDLYKILSHQMHNFLMSYAVKQIRKDGFDYAYIRVAEPHKDGVPHFHILFYLPEQYLPSVYKAFHAAFPAPRNAKKLTYKNTNGKHRRNAAEVYPGSGLYETFGFQTVVRSPAGYVLKYILKSFRNLIEDKDLDYLQAWYIMNKIPRMITSHTLVSQEIYHQVSPLDDDWFYLTSLRSEGFLTLDREKNYFIFDDDQGRQIIGDSGLVQIYHHGILVKEYGQKKEVAAVQKRDRTIMNYEHYIVRSLSDGSLVYFGKDGVTDISCDPDYHVDYDPALFYHLDILPPDCDLIYEELQRDIVSISSISMPITYSLASDGASLQEIKDSCVTRYKLSGNKKYDDFALMSEYLAFDFDKSSPVRFASLKKELIDKGFLPYEDIIIDDYAFFDRLSDNPWLWEDFLVID